MADRDNGGHHVPPEREAAIRQAVERLLSAYHETCIGAGLTAQDAFLALDWFLMAALRGWRDHFAQVVAPAHADDIIHELLESVARDFLRRSDPEEA